MARTKTLITPPAQYNRLAAEFRYLREQAGLSQRDVAKGAGLSPSQYSRIERGELIDRPAFEDILRLCRFFNMEPNRAASLVGLWPVKEVEGIDADPRIPAMLSFLAQLVEPYRSTLIEMMFRSVGAQITDGLAESDGTPLKRTGKAAAPPNPSRRSASAEN